MAVVYFTSNASTGAGSLAEAIQNAAPGDVIRPDESVFERGSTIEIVLASQLNVDKDLTLDASPFRVRLDGGGARRAAYIANGVVAEFTAFDFVACYSSASGGGARVDASAQGTFNRCLFAGCESTYGGGLAITATGRATLNDCAVVGCRATIGSGGAILASGETVLNGVTAIGCASPNRSDVFINAGASVVARNSIIGNLTRSATATLSVVGCVFDVASSSVGFVASPPDDLTVENWNANAWQNWDLRLLDDASGAPSPYRDSGDVDAASKYDLDGNFRGRETNGASTCSPGAYETIQADLFWVGRDATGAEVVAPSFLTSDGWGASRFATVSGDAAPQAGQTVFVDGAVTFVAFLSQSSKLKVGGGAVFASSDSSAVVRVSSLQVGLGATFNATFSAVSSGGRVGSWARLTQFGATSGTIEFDVASRADYLRFFAGDVSTTPSYGRLELRPNDDLKLRLSGVYSCSSLTIYHQDLNVSQLRIQADAATFRTKKLAFYLYHTRDLSLFSERVAFALQDVATATFPADAPKSWADEFEFDVSNATNATLTLNGQTIYGAAPTAAVSLTGSAKVAERGLDVASLTLNADAELTVDGAKINVAELTVADGATLIVDVASIKSASLTLNAGSTLNVKSAEVNVAKLTVADGANVAFSPVKTTDATDGGNSNDGNIANAETYVDAVLSATAAATVGAATFAGVGYFATPPETDFAAATFESYVRRVDYSAGVETFAATATGPTSATLAWSATDATARICVERENAAAPNGWEVVATTPTADGEPLEVALSGKERFRIFDGQTFYVDSAWFPTDKFYRYAATVVAVRNVRNDWKIRVKVVMPGSVCYRNEGARFLAQILDGAGTPLAPGDVASITATVYRIGDYLGRTWTPVDGWNAVEVLQTSLLETPTADADWPSNGDDDPGPNFVWTPDVAAKPIFPESGDYATQVKFALVGGGAVVVTFETSVK